MTELLRRNLIPLIVATALFMENMDATVLATSLPAIAKDLDANPINLKLALTTYLLALAVFIPASGWMADRFGAKNVFRAAMVVFAAGLDRLRAFDRTSLARRGAHPAGHGRRDDDAGRPPDRAAHRPEEPNHRRHRLAVHPGAGRPGARAAARRLHHDLLQLALDLLDQYSGGARSASRLITRFIPDVREDDARRASISAASC